MIMPELISFMLCNEELIKRDFLSVVANGISSQGSVHYLCVGGGGIDQEGGSKSSTPSPKRNPLDFSTPLKSPPKMYAFERQNF